MIRLTRRIASLALLLLGAGALGTVSPAAAQVPLQCVASQEQLCLQDSRFAVRLDWREPGGRTGQGLCSYNRVSETGVLLVIPTVDFASDPVDVVFSLRSTGVHP